MCISGYNKLALIFYISNRAVVPGTLSLPGSSPTLVQTQSRVMGKTKIAEASRLAAHPSPTHEACIWLNALRQQVAAVIWDDPLSA
jgi:hypothetical protein